MHDGAAPTLCDVTECAICDVSHVKWCELRCEHWLFPTFATRDSRHTLLILEHLDLRHTRFSFLYRIYLLPLVQFHGHIARVNRHRQHDVDDDNMLHDVHTQSLHNAQRHRWGDHFHVAPAPVHPQSPCCASEARTWRAQRLVDSLLPCVPSSLLTTFAAELAVAPSHPL